MFVREGFAGVGFQILFKIKRPLTVFKRQVSHRLPWFEFRGVGRLTPVVCIEPRFEIFGESDVGLIRIWNASQEIDVVHDNAMLLCAVLLTVEVLTNLIYLACHA